MVQRRSRSECVYDDAARPYPVRPETGWPLGEDAELDGALAELESALTACGNPLASSIAEITSQDVSSGLRSVPLERRPGLLRPLGLMFTPRRINQVLCQDVRNRMRRADGHAARHAAATLTMGVSTDILRSAFADEYEDASSLRDPLELWGSELCSLAVWSHGLASVRDARIWLWASMQPWFRPHGVSDEQIEAIVEAAERVIIASAEFTYRSSIEISRDELDRSATHDSATDDDAGRDDHEVGDQASGERAAPDETEALCGDDRRNLIVNADANVAKSAADCGLGWSDDRLVKLEDLAAASDELDSLLADGLQAAQGVVERLREKRPPAREDLTILSRTRETFDAVVAALAAAGSQVAEETMAAIREAVQEINAQAGDASARELLEVVCGVTASQEQALLVAQLSEAQAEARELLVLQPWDALARESAAILGLLVELATQGGGTESQMALMQRWSQARPALSFLALQAQKLKLPASPATPGGSVGEEQGADQVMSTGQLTTPASEQPSMPEAGRDSPAMKGAEQAAESVTPTPQPQAAAESDLRQIGEQQAAVEGEDSKQAGELDAEREPVQVPASQVNASLATLIGSGRLGFAASLERAAGWTPTQQAALRIAALAGVVRHQNGAVAAALRSAFDDLDPVALADDTPSLLLAVPALLRTALITGEPATGALLSELAAHVEPNLSEVAGQVGRRALHGVLLASQAMSVLADVTEVERGIHAITSTALNVRTRHRNLRFKRANDISKHWLDPSGLIGKPLSIAERNDMNAVDEVAADIEKLSNSSFVRNELAKLDRRLQGSSGKPIEGASKQDLLNLIQEALKPLGDWVEAVRAIEGRNSRSELWGTGEVMEMRSVVLGRRDGVLTAMAGFTRHNDPLIAAAGHEAVASLTVTFDILQDSHTLPVREPAPALALTVELLKVAGVSVDAALRQVSLPESVTVRDLLDAVDRGWEQALIMHVNAENFEAAHFLLEVAAADQLPVVEGWSEARVVDLVATVEQAESRVRAELGAERDVLTTTLRHARLNNEISDEQDGELTSLLEDARRRADGRDLAVGRRIQKRVATLLPDYRAEAKVRLMSRLEELQLGGRIDGGTHKRVTRLIDDGQLSTAEELIYFLEIDEDVPDVYQSHDLQRFFPEVPDALPGGLTRELITLVQKRGRFGACKVLDFSELSPDLAEAASDALNFWRQATHVEPAQRNNFSELSQLLPALRMIGIETSNVRKLNDWPRSRDRRFIDVTVNAIIGKALVPAFGSKIDGRLRLLLAWGQPSADLLMSWADGDPSGESLLIAHFGTMSSQTRRDLAVKAAGRSAPIVVLDDAALAYLAAHGKRQMTATMNVLLPFSSVNPYLRQKRGVVAPEMFYGRDQERRSVLDPDGTQLVFGGRGLGKSALLNSAAELFQEQTKIVGERVAVYIDLKAVGIRADSAINQEAIWDALLDRLKRRAVLAERPKGARGISPHDEIQSGVQAWLDADSRRRLLVLLDEADQFFEADMPHFLETTRLKSLGQQSNGRVKVVFAGLHSVQRFAKSARNAPFGHMAQRPTVIGPLKPQHAANLLTKPLAALGFRFEDPDLVNRVLGYCSYQPFLLQIFANRLIEAMHERRRAIALGADEPPYVIRLAEVEAVETHADLRADIRTAFHETLNLDHRYGVIAHVLAYHAHERGLDARLTDTQLREECLSYWHSGFAKLDVEGFRAYLQEMTGFGVLAPNNDGRGWHLRSANVLNMIGPREDIEAQLVMAAELSVPDEFLALEARLALAGGQRSPLTAAQIDDVMGDHSNQVRIVLGSPATGVSLVGDAIRAAADIGHRFTVPPVSSRRQFEEQLVVGKPGERRVVLDDLVNVAPNEMACAEALQFAQTRRPSAPGVTRSAVIVAGPEQMNLWRQVFAQSEDASLNTSGMLPLGTVTLRRYDMTSLRVWSMETNLFTTEDRRAQLLLVTGGWPMLVERAANLVRGEPGIADAGRVDEPEALRRLDAELAAPKGASALVAAVGLSGNEHLCRAFEGVLSVIDSGRLTRSDLDAAVELSVDDPSTMVACLIALQVFDVDADGMYVPEPLLVRCWPHRT